MKNNLLIIIAAVLFMGICCLFIGKGLRDQYVALQPRTPNRIIPHTQPNANRERQNLPPVSPEIRPEIRQDIRQSPPNKMQKLDQIISADTVLVINKDITFPANSTETWLVGQERNIVCGLFYSKSANTRVLQASKELKIISAKRGNQFKQIMPGNRSTNAKEEFVIECTTEHGVKIFCLIVSGDDMKVTKDSRVEAWKWQGTSPRITNVAEAENFFKILLEDPRPIKVPLPNYQSEDRPNN